MQLITRIDVELLGAVLALEEINKGLVSETGCAIFADNNRVETAEDKIKM